MEMNDFELVRKSVEMVMGVDIFTNNRKRTVVESRMMYGLIMRELGHSLNQIGNYLKKDHTTIIHYQKTMNNLIDTDVNVLKTYLRCKELIDSQKQPVNLSDPKNEVLKLRIQLDKLRTENLSLAEELDQIKVSNHARFAKILKLMEDNTPVGHELILERKIRKMFDE
jgi:hypothetical protein